MRHPAWNYFEMLYLLQMRELGMPFRKIAANLAKTPTNTQWQYRRFKETGNMLCVNKVIKKSQEKVRPQDERMSVAQSIREIRTVSDPDKYWLSKMRYVAPQFREMYQERYRRLVK